jgi:uncharacterized protein (TIGR00251 family)
MTQSTRLSCVTAHADGSLLAITVVPRSSRTGVELAVDGTLRVRVTAPPVDGAANAAVLRFLADLLDVPRSRLSIVTGFSSRQKRIVVAEMTPQEVERRIQQGISRAR